MEYLILGSDELCLKKNPVRKKQVTPYHSWSGFGWPDWVKSGFNRFQWACSLRGILKKFGWFGGILKEFVREKHYFGWKKEADQAGFMGTWTGPVWAARHVSVMKAHLYPYMVVFVWHDWDFGITQTLPTLGSRMRIFLSIVRWTICWW